ncbi:hypothetical protein [Kitasatospora sp. NPDC015120]|uniref:hypothetical protein n=1 Tax=Kitasatospora sp. NPDC015120 TaxID=3364023 RepID=UPI0036F45A9E
MFRDRSRPARPTAPTWQEHLREFEVPVAVLAQPDPGRRVLVARQGVDDFLNQLDIAYYDDDRSIAVQVTTHRPLPGRLRITSDLHPPLLLADFLANASPHGPIELPDEPLRSTGHLVVDGVTVPADRLVRGDYMITSATVANTTIAVISTAELHDQAIRLRLESTDATAATPQPRPRPTASLQPNRRRTSPPCARAAAPAAWTSS